MSLKRETLIEAGVTDKDKIDTIMQAYGAGIESAKAQVKADTTAEIDSLKEQLQAQTDRVTSLLEENKANADVKTTLEQLQTEYDNFKTESENKLAQVNKNNAIALSLKDVNAYDSDVIMKLIDVDSVELDETGKPKLDDVIANLKESKPFLFKQEQEQQTPPTITVGGNPDGTGGKAVDPFQAIIDSYNK